MFLTSFYRRPVGLLVTTLLLTLSTLPAAAGLNDLFGKQEIDETERQQTIERIESIQENLKLLQDKLRALERRKAAKAAEQRATELSAAIPAVPVQINWQPFDETTTSPGEFGLYSYLLFKGELTDTAAIGSLEDLILTIETLPESEVPAGLANRFLVPVERPQSLINLGRQAYDFRLSEACLQRLQLPAELPVGPLLVSLQEPLDPFGTGDLPAFLAVSLGRQAPQRALQLAGLWHRQEKAAVADAGHPVAGLFWEVIDGAGPVQVVRDGQRLLIALTQP